MNVAYLRVSTIDQHLDRQLEGVDVERVFSDKVSGKDTNRPALQEMLGFVREGDTVHVHSIDRLARNLDDLRKLVMGLRAKGVTVHFHKEGFVFSAGVNDPMVELMFNMLGAFAEFERAIIHERQREGIALAKERGVYKGRQSRFTEADVADIKARIASGESKSSIAKAYNVSRQTIYALSK